MNDQDAMEDRERGNTRLSDDAEVRALLEAAQRDTPPEFEFPPVDDPDEGTKPKPAPADTQDPDKAWALYYGKIQRFLAKRLPKGPEHASARKLIRAEISLYLKEGHVKGRDSRQAYYHRHEAAAVILRDWAESGKPLYDLLAAFQDANRT